MKITREILIMALSVCDEANSECFGCPLKDSDRFMCRDMAQLIDEIGEEVE